MHERKVNCPYNLIIEAASDIYLRDTLTDRESLLGRYVFDVFPDNPQVPDAHGVRNLHTSLMRVLTTGQPHEMARQRYDVPDPAQPGQFVERYWLQRNSPVLDAHGRVSQLIHMVIDATAAVKDESRLRESQAAEKAARAETEAQRQRFYDVLMQLPAQIATYHGPDYVYAFVNPRYQRCFPNHALLGRPVREVSPEAGEQGIFDLLARVYQTGEPFYGQEVELWLDFLGNGQREQVFLNAFFHPLRDAQGNIDGLLDFSYDVTEQVRARQQLQTLNEELEARVLRRTQEAQTARAEAERQRQQFESLLMRAPAAICVLAGPDLVYELVNPGYQELFPNRPLLGLPVLEALPELAGQPLVTIIRGVYETGISSEGKEVLVTLARTTNGPVEDIYFDFTYQARFDEAGRIDGFICYAYDVTERVLARQEREAQQRQLHTLFMQAPAPIVILDGPDLGFQLVNPAYQQIFPGRELLGKALLTAMPELVGAPILEILRQVYQTGTAYVAQEMLVPLARHEGGPVEELYFTFIYQVRRDGQGTVDGILVFGHEVTSQVQARRVVEENERQAQAMAGKLARANDQLTRTNVDLDNFIYTASHDLKAPITNIEGLLHALLAELPPANLTNKVVQSILGMMQGAVDRFKQTIDQLTDVTKLQQEHAQPTEQINLTAVVENVRLDLLPLIQETGAHLDIAVENCPTLAFSAKNLRSVVYNLLSNALKYRHPDRAPRVRIHCQREAGRLLLRVEDNGLGLDEAQQARLFGMFQRLHTHVEGSGIGLYMVKKMVENVGGKIEVESQVGVGSVFSVSFPV